MVDTMNIEGGPSSVTNVKKLVLIVMLVLCIVLSAGALAVVFTLERTISCHDDDVKFFVKKVELPVITSVEPAYTCLAQGERKIVFSGSNFIKYNDEEPMVKFGAVSPTGEFKGMIEGGESLEIFRQEVTSAKTLTVMLKNSNITTVSQPDVAVVLAVPDISSAHFTSKVDKFASDGCGTVSKKLVVVPPPTFGLVAPRVMCTGSKQLVTIQGADFVFLGATDNFGAATTTSTAAMTTTTVAATTTEDTTATTTESTTATPTTTSMRKRQEPTTTVAETTVGETTASSTTTTTTMTTAAATTAPGAAVTLAKPTTRYTTSDASSQPNITVGSEAIKSVAGSVCTPAAFATNLTVCTQIQFEVDVDALMKSNVSNPVLSVTNPPPILCSTKAPVYIIGPASITTLNPQVLFPDLEKQSGRVIGANFVVLDGVPPTITFEDEARRVVFTAINVKGEKCDAQKDNGMADAGVQVCAELTYEVEANSTSVDDLRLVVKQPSPISNQCNAVKAVALLKAPAITNVTAELICNGEPLTFTGRFYEPALDMYNPSGLFSLKVDGVALTSDQFTLAGCGVELNEPYVRLCTQVVVTSKGLPVFYNASTATRPVITIEQTGLPLPGVMPYTDLVTFVPPLEVRLAPPSGICSATDGLTFRGVNFVRFDNAPPIVTLLGGSSPFVVPSGNITLANCTMSLGPGGKMLELCQRMTVFTGSLPSARNLTISNPAPLPAKCGYRLPTAVATVPQPLVTAGQTFDVCLGGLNQSITVAGTASTAALPQLEIAGVLFKNVRCTSMTGMQCMNMQFDIDDTTARDNYMTIQDARVNGSLSASVRINDNCKATNTIQITTLPIATVTRVSPARICAALPTTLTVTGVGFSKNPAAIATLPGGNINLSSTPTDCDANGVCPTIIANTTSLVSYVSLNETLVAVGVSNKGCQAATPNLLTIVPVPIVKSVRAEVAGRIATNTEPQVCTDRATNVTLIGFGFATSMPPTVRLVPVNITNQATFTASNIVVTSSQITFSVAMDVLLPGTYDVEVTNMAGCVSPKNGTATQLFVHPKVVVYSVVPSVLARNVTASVLVYVDGVVGQGSFAGGFLSFLATPNGTQVGLRGTVKTPFAGAYYSGDFVGQLMTDAPYYVRFETQLGCSGVSATPLFTVLPAVDTTATFAPIGGIVGTEIEFRGPVPFGFGTVVYMQLPNSQFELLSRPHLLDNGGVRAELISTVSGGTRLRFFIVDHSSTPPKVYNCTTLFTVSAAVSNVDVLYVTPQAISAMTGPATVRLQLNQQLSLNVTSCELRCSNPTSIIACTFGDIDDEFAEAIIPTNMVQAGQYCRVVGNEKDGGAAYIQSPAFAILQSSGAPATINATTSSLRQARVGACGVVTRVQLRRGSWTRRPVGHVIGGRLDLTTVLATTEIVSFVFGLDPTFGAGRPLAFAVEGAACLQLGAYVYAIGGRAATTPVDMQRARVLDSIDAPLLTAALAFGAGNKFSAAAQYRYVVTFEYALDGESLPSNVVEIAVVPQTQVELLWSRDAMASGGNPTACYVYRATGLVGALQRIAQLAGTATSYIDANAMANATVVAPPSGALGNWNAVTTNGATTNPGQYATAIVADDGRAYVVGGTNLGNRSLSFADAPQPIGLTSSATGASLVNHVSVATRFAGNPANALYITHIGATSYASQSTTMFTPGAATIAASANMCARAYATGANSGAVYLLGDGKLQRGALAGTTLTMQPSTADATLVRARAACLASDGRMVIAGGADLAANANQGSTNSLLVIL